MENDYPFTWFDELIEIKWNPDRPDFKMPTPAELAAALSHTSCETDLLIYSLKRKAFSLLDEHQKAAVIRAYLENLSALRQRAFQNLLHYNDQSDLAAAGENIMTELEGLQERIQKRYAAYLRQLTRESPASAEQVPFKVLVRLSVDQIAIILKAADDIKILASRSLSLVFRSIMPFVSTEKFKHVSWKSARSSTYKMEESDKISVVSLLEQLIAQINRY